MKNGKRYEGMKNTKEFSRTTFDEYGILIEKDVPNMINVGASAGIIEAIPTLALILNQQENNKKKYLAELMWRISLPLSTLLLIF